MRVFDLQCASGHVFEGWFASEEAFATQCERLQVACPYCDGTDVKKLLSAPRLNLRSSAQVNRSATGETSHTKVEGDVVKPDLSAVPVVPMDRQLLKLWLERSRHVLATTEDVGSRFVEETRQMHEGVIASRNIRGLASASEVVSLWEDGIHAIPLLVPAAAKRRLQ